MAKCGTYQSARPDAAAVLRDALSLCCAAQLARRDRLSLIKLVWTSPDTRLDRFRDRVGAITRSQPSVVPRLRPTLE